MIEKFKFKKFTKKDRSTFPYWYYHWKAYNLTAIELGQWKFKYLFHDFEKPWLRLFLPYEKVKKIHRTHNRHHVPRLEDKPKKVDWEAAVIDWECSRYTKIEAPLDAFDTYKLMVSKTDKYDTAEMEQNVPNVLNKFGLWKE